ncbi:unnamed protein product [Pedinophyceae sp. YPF-701]|nr:unnamed protein product [Pedinophyceae sp. YPF-701]
MVSVTYRGNTFRVPKGTKLRTALLKNQLSPHNGRATLINCRGLGTCGTCAVEIKAAAQTGALPVAPAAWTAQERLRLNFPPHKPPGNQRLRLACQVSCQGDLEVLKRDQFWGQGEDVLGEVAPSDDLTWFGPLEFVLDPNAGALPDKKSNGQDGK